MQLAAARGAVVIATGLPDDAKRLRALGASEIVDYRDDATARVLDAHPAGVDALIDLVSYDADGLETLAAAVRDGAVVASTLGSAEDPALSERGITGTNISASPTRETLATPIAEIERGAVRVDVEQTLPLAHAADGSRCSPQATPAASSYARSRARSTAFRCVPTCFLPVPYVSHGV